VSLDTLQPVQFFTIDACYDVTYRPTLCIAKLTHNTHIFRNYWHAVHSDNKLKILTGLKMS